MRVQLLGLVLLAGCANLALAAGCANLPPNRPLVEPEARAIAAARAVWRDAGRPEMDPPKLAPDRVRVAVLSPREVADRCLACYPGPRCRDLHACSYMVNATAFERPRLVVYVTSASPSPIPFVVHEYLHAYRAHVVEALLEDGAELPAWAVQGENGAAGDLPDRPHRDVELWGPIEADAMARLRGVR